MWTIMYEEANLVSRQRGTLPVILSCPHGGSRQPEDVPVESDETNPNHECRPVKKQSDVNTREITTHVAQRLLHIFGEASYVASTSIALIGAIVAFGVAAVNAGTFWGAFGNSMAWALLSRSRSHSPEV